MSLMMWEVAGLYPQLCPVAKGMMSAYKTLLVSMPSAGTPVPVDSMPDVTSLNTDQSAFANPVSTEIPKLPASFWDVNPTANVKRLMPAEVGTVPRCADPMAFHAVAMLTVLESPTSPYAHVQSDWTGIPM